MAFKSYAQGREFQTITLPTPTMQTGAINRILENKRFTAGQADDSFKLQQEFAKIHLQHGIASAQVASDNLRTNQWILDKNQTLMQEQELRNYKIAIDAAKAANPQSKEALTDKFGSLFELIPQFASQVAEIKEKQNQADYNKGINLINRVRATSAQIAELRAVEGELQDEDKNYVQAAQVLKNQGATDDDLYTIRNSSGWVHFGIVEAGLSNLARQFNQYFLNNIDKPYPIGEENLSYNEAKESGNPGAVENILSQMQAEFGAAAFKQLGIETPNHALATGFFEKLDEVSNARYDEALRTSLIQAETVNNDTRRIQVFNALDKGGIKAYFSEFINGYEDKNNKLWRRNAIAASFGDVVAYFEQPHINIDQIQKVLEERRPDGTPLLGTQNKLRLQKVIADKQARDLEISNQGWKRRKQAIEQAKLQILAMGRGQELNDEAKFQLQETYKDIPELHQWIGTLITSQVTDEQNTINAAELERAFSQGLGTTEMVLQAEINQATKSKFLSDKRLDNPFPNQKKEFETLISGELKSLLKITSWQDVSNHEHSLRAASAHIHEKTMDRFTDLMRNGNMDSRTAFNEALAYGRAEIAALKITPYQLGDPNSGYIEGYRVDANGSPISNQSAIARRQLFAQNPNFINVSPQDTKEDYEYLQQKLASGSVLTADILNDKFPWVRDVVDLYGGHLTAQEVLEANAKTVGVNLTFPATTEPSNLSPALLRQHQILANNLGQIPGQILTSLDAQRLSKITPPTTNRAYQVTSEDTTGILNMASQLNLDPRGLAALLHLESGLDPNNWGGDGGNYVGIIQFGEGARSETGLPSKANWKNMTIAEQIPYAIQYLKGRGYVPTADPQRNLMLVYATILGGNPNVSIDAEDSNGMSVRKGMDEYFKPGTRTYDEALRILGWGN